MKKAVILLSLVLVLMLPLGDIAQARYGNFDLGGEFQKWVDNNPLDRDYQRDMSDPTNYQTNDAMARVTWKYAELWDRELNVIYQKLLLKLNDKEKALLIDSQVAWLQYHENEQAFVNETFLARPVGTYFRIQKLNAYRLRLKDRTLELMEYYIRLGGKLELEYKGTE